ncbi:unnamed protein product [Chilo suppressalis]|uniref:Exportin-1/Importin-beta-like domain-containing protein n=1 Tax=Chilo suppressalis TaxID=168631 RepID=A0ABN8BFT2_CHISP|nr:unnamed protein product [Chilo suppressalis]
MEFCPQLSAFQGVMISADNVHSFSRLTSKAGNEDKFKYIIENISKFLLEERYISLHGLVEESISKTRKFAFYIILNADMPIIEAMADMEVTWTIPTIPKCLMCEIFWELHFEKFVYETIAFTHPDLGLEIASAFIDSIKYFSPSECLNKLQVICSALYKLVCRSYFFNFSDNELVDKLTVVFNHFQKCVSFYTNPPKAEKLNAMSKDECYRYIGNCLHSILLLVDECFEQFTANQTLNPLNDDVYMLTYYIGMHRNECTEVFKRNIEFKICETPNTIIADCLNKVHTALLDKFQEVVMGVSVDIFCAWSEFEECGESVQRKIGELCYKVRTKLLSIPNVSEHPVVSMTLQISCKPVELGDIVESASIETIVENISQCSEGKIIWLRALIQRDEVFSSESIVDCVASNLDLLNENECFQIYKNLRNYVLTNAENVEYLKPFAVKLFQHCSYDGKQEILEEYFSNHCFVDMLETPEFVNTMTETFNKLIGSPDADLTDILCLFLQNPQKLYSKIFNLAAENMQQANIMLRAMKLLENYSSHYYTYDTEPCIIRISQNSFCNLNTLAKKNNFIYFLCELKNMNNITGTKLLLLIIMPNIHKALLNSDISSLNTQCMLLKAAYTLEELLEYRAPMLAMIGQILNTVRWKVNTFESISPSTLQLALEIQSSLFSTYEAEIPENESNWLKTKLRNLLPLNMYYYRKLWNPPGNNFVEIITGLEVISGMSTVQLGTRLSQALCSCCQQEWINMWDSLAALTDAEKLEIFYDSVFLISMLERSHRTETTWACMLYCYRCFIYVIRYKFFKEPLDDVQVSIAMEKIALTCNFAEDDNTEDLSAVILPLFAYLAEKSNDYNFQVSAYLRTKLKNTVFQEAFTKVFVNGAD